MTKHTLFAAAIVAGFAITGCKKDKAPTNAEKIVGTWDVQQLRVGTDIYLPYTEDDATVSMTYTFDSDGDFNQNFYVDYFYGNYSYDFPGTITTSDTELDFSFSPNSPGAMAFESSLINNLAENYYQYNENYQIIELTEAGSMKLSGTINGKLVTLEATKR